MKKILFLVGWLILFQTACKKKDDTPNYDKNGTPTAIGTNFGSPALSTIGASGGSISSPDGLLELVIPSGALTSDIDFEIQPITN